MNATQKTTILEAINAVAKMVASEYGLRIVPRIEINAKQVRQGACGFYRTTENLIVIRPSQCDLDTVAHELAHFAQFQIFGETECKASINAEVAGVHYRMQKEIEAKIKDAGLAKAIDINAF